MNKNEIKAKHKEWAVKEVNRIREQMNYMTLDKPQLRNMNLDKYDLAMSEWRGRYNDLETEAKRIYSDWNNGIDFIY